ncbi:MAG: phosphoribosylglycinamide formyltransferase [Nitrospinota bacterium]
MNSLNKYRIGVLASGRGSNFKAIATAIKDQKIDATISILIVDNKDAPVLKLASEFGIKSETVDRKDYSSKDQFELAILHILELAKVDLICLAGFMRILSSQFLSRVNASIVNIHPSLLPKYPGLNPQQQALAANDTESGCTVHFVDEGIDTGPIILQKKVAIDENETVESLSQKILLIEHQLYPEAIGLLISNRFSPKVDQNES